MIQHLNIRNFKSIKDLNLPTKKLNIFIGEPNSGKSNIIEALSMLSQNSINTQELNKSIFRYHTLSDLFFDFDINNPIEVNTDINKLILQYAINNNRIPLNKFQLSIDPIKTKEKYIKINHDGTIDEFGEIINTNIHFYEYKRLSGFSDQYQSHLSVPDGKNLPSLLLSNNDNKKWVSEFLRVKGYHLNLKPAEYDMMFSKIIDDEIYSYPYQSLSETLQRIIFYSIALKSNKNNVLLFDEPETNTFPFYTKQLAEMIALDETNQFFITTHNPYMLLSLIEKSKINIKDINVCITQMKDYQTILTPLDNDQLTQVVDFESDVFFNFDKILNK